MLNDRICKKCKQHKITSEHSEYCEHCFLYNFMEDDCEDDELEFKPCSKCDGHPACEDFGCAYNHGLSHLVNKELGSNDW